MIKNQQTILVRSLAAAFAVGTVVIATPAFAEEDVIPVVNVTAQSRKQVIQDVPITLQVVSAKDIEAIGARDLSDMNGYIPGFTADDSEPTEPVFSIRGVQGGGDFGIGTDSPVGIYEDGVYTGKTGGALMNFIDVQRIEVIKGPQGTLFGRNSAAGAISIVTNEPSQDLDMLAHLKLGKFGTDKLDAMINVPVSDTSAVRLVMARNASAGWVPNETTGKTSGGTNDWATRLMYLQKIDAAKINVSWEHEVLNQDARPAFGVVTDPTQPLSGFTGTYTPAYIANFVNPLKTPLIDNTQGLETRTFDGITVRADVPLGGVNFNSTTGYRVFRTWDATDNAGNNRPDVAINTLDAKKSHSLQQEFKLSGKNDTLDWISGVSFYHNSESQISGANTTTATIDTLIVVGGGQPVFSNDCNLLGSQLGVPGVNAASVFPWAEFTYSSTVTQSESVYGDTIWHLNPSSNLTVGLRWSDDKKTMTWYTPGRISPEIDTLIATYVPGLSSLVPQNILFSNTATYSGTPVSRTKSWTDFSPRVVLDHKVDQDTMVFASLSQGYQAGGFNVFTPPNPASTVQSLKDPSFSPEKMTNLELGSKLLMPAVKATLDASLFAYRFSNLQDITLSGAPGTIPTYNVTTSDHKAFGLDVDGRIKAASNVTLFGAFEYINATYTKYDQVGSTGASVSLAGQPVGTPFFTGMAGMNVTWNALDGHASWNIQGTHTTAVRRCSDSSMLSCISAPNIQTGVPTTKFDTRLGWQSEDRRYGAALLINNLFDKRYVQYMGGQLTSIGMPYATITPPRFIGVEFTASM